MNHQPKIGDIYAAMNRIHNKWVLWQVIKDMDKDKPKTGIVMLDWFSSDLPSQDQIAELKPLFIDHHYWQGDYNLRYLFSSTPPKNYQWIANRVPVIDIEINCYGGWPSVNHGIGQYEWLEIPEAERIAFRKAMNSKNEVLIMEQERKEDSHSIWLYEQDGPMRWADLDLLPALNQIHFEGNDLSIIDYLQTRFLLQELSWRKHQHSQIDLRKTHLTKLTIDITHLTDLQIPDSLKSLSLIGDYKNLSQLKIQQHNQGVHLELHLHYLRDKDIPAFPLPELRKLSLRADKIDFNQIVQAYPQLSCLHGWGNPGMIHNFDQLKLFKKFEDLQLMDFFGFTEKDFPTTNEMPLLDRLWLTSIPEAVGKWAKKEYKDIEPEISKLRKSTWLEANLDNPFRAWDGRDGISAAKAKKAFDAYKNACASIAKLANSPGDPEQEKQIISEFTQVFNKMEAKGGIDTLERDEISDVFRMLVEKMNTERNTYDDYFDSIRNF
jgi:hypothetical protein